MQEIWARSADCVSSPSLPASLGCGPAAAVQVPFDMTSSRPVSFPPLSRKEPAAAQNEADVQEIPVRLGG